MKRYFFLGLLAALTFLPQAGQAEERFFLEKLGGNDFFIARSYLDGYDSLAPRERVLLYYLTRAAIAGRDIYYDQRHRDAVKIRTLTESLLEREDLPGSLRNRLAEYAKYLWVNNSQYHARTGIKLKPRFSAAELKPLLASEEIDWAKKTIFDAGYEPILTNLTPRPEEGDILTASATNIYASGITLKEIETLPSHWTTKLNVAFEKRDSRLEPVTYRIGGRYSNELSNVVYFLKKALPLTEGLQKKGLAKLIRYYESGDEKMFRKASVDWLRAAPTVDTINGFVESYMDPRQTVGSWEGLAYFTAQDPLLKSFAGNVQYFEDRMPWKEEYRKKKITSKPVANLINVAAAVGEAGPVTWSGINLPNYQDIRAKYGSKNVILSNMIEARSQVTRDMMINEFYHPEYRSLMRKHYATARKMLLYMHEVIGHGSGKADRRLKGDPRDPIGKNYGAWEEARASLVAWHHITDPKLMEIGAFSEKERDEVIKAFYLLELQGQLTVLRHAEGEDILREAHDRADQMIFEYVRRHTKGFEVVRSGGKYYVRINDTGAIHKAASELLKIVHEAKATGDKETVDRFLEEFGNRFNVAWRDDVIRRANAVGYPEAVAFVFPKQVPVFNARGEITDVRVENDERFAEQQRRFGLLSKTTRVDKEVH